MNDISDIASTKVREALQKCREQAQMREAAERVARHIRKLGSCEQGANDYEKKNSAVAVHRVSTYSLST